MFDNIGGKIKLLAKIMFCIMAIGSVIGGIVIISDGYDDVILVGVAVMLLGPLFAWVSSWFMYGFGELIEKTGEIARNTYPGTKSVTQAKVDFERINKLEKLRAEGLITEEEYQQAIANIH